jgi:hypothetical protein
MPSSADVERNVMRQQLRDLQIGYVWVVPSAAEHLGPQQTEDVFSDVFSLKGMQWEVCVSPCTAPEHAARGSSDGLLDVKIVPVGHDRRMDFRVVAFAGGHWHSRPCKAWPASAKGKPWGIAPFISRQQLLSHFVSDNVLKLCISPMSDLY